MQSREAALYQPTTCQRHLHKAPTSKEARFREIATHANCLIIQLDPNGNVVFINNYAEEALGFRAREILGRNALETFISPEGDTGETFKAMLGNIWQEPERYHTLELEYRRRDGFTMWILSTNKALSGGDGSMKGLLSVGTDITRRRYEEELLRQCCASLENRVNERTAELNSAYERLSLESKEREWAEKILRDSEEKYRLVVENASEAIVVIQDHYIKYFNPRTLKVMNLSPTTLRTRPVDEIIHPEDRDRASERRLKMLKGEAVPSLYSLRILDKNGVVRWLELNSVLITWMGRPATLAFFNNVTERKRAEAEVKVYEDQLRSLASELSLAEEKERRRLATDLHDHIGQTLAIVNMKLGALRQEIDTCPDQQSIRARNQISYIQGLVEKTVHHTKSLTFELSPPTLYELGFEATLEWFGELVEKEHGVRVVFDDDRKRKVLAPDVNVLMFQAVRELLMNVVKHARARDVTISCQRVRNTMQICIEDDGIGFDVSKIGATTFGFFSVRERLKHFGGTMMIDADPGRGTRVTLSAPLASEKSARVESLA